MKRYLALLGAVVCLTLPTLSLAQTPPPTDEATAAPTATATPIPGEDLDLEGAVDLLPTLLEAIQEKNWNLVASIVLLLLVFGIRTYVWKSIPKEWIPIATVALAIAGATSGGLMVGKPVSESILLGVTVGVGTIGVFELFKAIKRLVTGKRKDG